MDLYTEIILDHYKNPHHAGTLLNPTISLCERNASCGDHMALNLQIERGVIADIAFESSGCAISRAATSMLCDEVIGKSIDILPTEDEVIQMLGVPISPSRMKCALLGLSTIKKGIREIKG